MTKGQKKVLNYLKASNGKNAGESSKDITLSLYPNSYRRMEPIVSRILDELQSMGFISQSNYLCVDRKISPDFDDESYEDILKWANANVYYSTDIVHEYTLSWKYGSVGFPFIPRESEKEARRAAALFIYFWTRHADVRVAKMAATAYVLAYKG